MIRLLSLAVVSLFIFSAFPAKDAYAGLTVTKKMEKKAMRGQKLTEQERTALFQAGLIDRSGRWIGKEPAGGQAVRDTSASLKDNRPKNVRPYNLVCPEGYFCNVPHGNLPLASCWLGHGARDCNEVAVTCREFASRLENGPLPREGQAMHNQYCRSR